MIYVSSSVIISTSPKNLWDILKKFLKSEKQGKFIAGCTIYDETDNSFERKILLNDDSELKENVSFNEDKLKVTIALEDHPLFIGDTIFQIVASDKEELNDRKSTLCGVIAWRMRPGIIEAPSMGDKKDFIDDVLWSILEQV